MLTGYTYKENLDTIIVGNSITKMVDCDVLDLATGYNSYNMGTPSQTFSITKSIVEMSAAQHPVKRVIIITGYDSFEKDSISVFEKIFNKTRNASKPYPIRQYRALKGKFSEATDSSTIKTTDSVSLWFDWVDNSVGDIKSVKNNYNIRVLSAIKYGKRLGDGYAFDLDKKVYDRSPLDYSDVDKALFYDDMQLLANMNITEGVLDIDSLQKLDEICKYCEQNNIELSYFISPHQSAYKERYEGNYEKVDSFLSEFLTKRGVKYYNFENDPDIHAKLPDEYFYDWEHVEDEYTDEATNVFVEKIMN